jgi:uncharacterized protein YndB with AHSA1/START domain
MEVDVARYLGAVTRSTASFERDGRPARSVVAARTYPTSVDDLWDAITNAERIPRWFLPVSGDLRLGGRYQLEGNASGEITECEPPRRLALTWEFGGGISWLHVSLWQEGEGSRLELEHVAYEDEHWDQFGPGAAGVGWDMALLGLALHVAPGAGDPGAAGSNAVIAPEEAMAWMASPNGREFMRGSSEAWLDAAVSAGADKTTAAAAAARTTAFYAGESAGDGAGPIGQD